MVFLSYDILDIELKSQCPKQLTNHNLIYLFTLKEFKGSYADSPALIFAPFVLNREQMDIKTQLHRGPLQPFLNHIFNSAADNHNDTQHYLAELFFL